MKLFALIFSLIASLLTRPSVAFAEIEIISVTGASGFERNLNDLNETGTPVIYGGTAGSSSDARCPKDGVTPCDNCETLDGDFEICNSRRIYNSLLVEIRFRSDANDSGGRAFLEDRNGTSLNAEPTVVLGPGAVHTVKARWEDICKAVNETATGCEDLSDKRNLTLVIKEGENNKDTDQVNFFVANPSPDDESFTALATIDACNESSGEEVGGVCEFTAYPGDGKVFLDQVGKNGTFPNENNIQIEAVRVFITDDQTDKFTAIDDPASDPRTLEFEDLAVTTNTDNSTDIDQTVGGLENGTRYYFRVGVVDKAGNLTRITSDAAIGTYCGSGPTDSGALTSPSDTCLFSATPDEVLGLLSEDFNCFIATAAYGSPLDSRLDIFRDFRAKILSRSGWGRKLVAWYYKKGPYAAKWIHERPSAKFMVQVGLWPALGFAWVANNLGLWVACIFTFISLGLICLCAHRGLHQWKKHV